MCPLSPQRWDPASPQRKRLERWHRLWAPGDFTPGPNIPALPAPTSAGPLSQKPTPKPHPRPPGWCRHPKPQPCHHPEAGSTLGDPKECRCHTEAPLTVQGHPSASITPAPRDARSRSSLLLSRQEEAAGPAITINIAPLFPPGPKLSCSSPLPPAPCRFAPVFRLFVKVPKTGAHLIRSLTLVAQQPIQDR